MSSESASEAYAPQCLGSGEEEEPLRRYRRRIEKAVENSVEGKWTEEENLKYALFMDFHSKIFLSKEKRKSTRIFKALSKFLSTRTPRQCRSHFQKIIGKFKTIKKVKQYYQDTLGVLEYQVQFNSIAKQLECGIIKIEEKEEVQVMSTTTVEVQTDPLVVSLSDLPHSELIKLTSAFMHLHQAQLPYWMHRPYYFPPSTRF